jgi:hypothetical protein
MQDLKENRQETHEHMNQNVGGGKHLPEPAL